nr:MAG: ORF1 [Torque teno midi virus]
MPFWWARRKKPWYYNRRRYKRWRRPKRKYKRRRRTRRPFRRRRRLRRRHKVRRKKKKIFVQQWQPDSIVKCKIKGIGCLVAGAEGRQMFSYTNEIPNYLQPRAPGGGGFGCEVFTLKYLYDEWVAHRNIWTKTNEYKDLCRYTGTTITLFRHPTTDFIFSYTRMPPFGLTKETYSDFHPTKMLLQKHHRVILSKKSNPRGKLKIKIKIPPPKQMLTKWFFQQQFATAGLFQMQAAAMNTGWSYFGQNTQSANLTLYALNTKFYTNASYGGTLTTGYLPYNNYPEQGLDFYWNKKNAKDKINVKPFSVYWDSVSYTGMFQPKILNAYKVTHANSETPTHELPIVTIRYNPMLDTGEQTYIWATSIHTDTWHKPTDNDLIMQGRPLWLGFYGFWNYILKVKDDKTFLQYHMFVVSSPAIKRVSGTTQSIFPLLDSSFIAGNMPYQEYLSDNEKKFWYPTCMKQQEVINAIVESGPYIPKYANLPESTWNLTYRYTSYFKWGGPEVYDTPVNDPNKQPKYDVPDTISQAIQISNPLKETCEGMLRAWDYRRGIITKSALKRMSENIPSDSSFESDTSETPKKKKKITAELQVPGQDCKEIKKTVLSLFEESTCQESTQDLQQLIHHQQQQQEKLKLNIIKLLTDLKQKQRILQLQAGIE